MPRGRYSLHDPHDGTPLADEHFHCAPGPGGWRYTARRTAPDAGPHAPELGAVDLAVDDLGRPVRLELRGHGWQLRGAALDGVTWVRTDPTDPTGEHAEHGNVRAAAFTGASPAFLVATARLIAPRPGAPATRVRLVRLTEPALAPRTEDLAWALLGTETHPTDSGPLAVDTHQVTDLATGEVHTVHLAGDVVLAAPGIELEDLDTPPSTFPPRD
ncbi:hypothetical protein ACN20G_16165 [Streptomyces sp. BI20]|uniref:hypothetical protein n=1 Tax=Streptomyces sp. BI20 TaxID=3403460 RepID=UPI003C794ACA